MAEKNKKRYRPTVTEVRALRNELEATKENYKNKVKENEELYEKVKKLKKELDDQIDGTSNIVKESDAWREKYNKLMDEIKELKNKSFPNDTVPKVKYDELDANLTKQKHALDDMTNEKKALADNLSLLQKDYDAVCAENLALKSRGFWARLFNK